MSSGFRRVQVHLWVWPCCLDPNEQQFVHARHQGGRDDDGHVVSVQIRGFFLVLNNEYVQKKKNSNFWRSPLPYCKHYQHNHKHSTASHNRGQYSSCKHQCYCTAQQGAPYILISSKARCFPTKVWLSILYFVTRGGNFTLLAHQQFSFILRLDAKQVDTALQVKKRGMP